MRRVTAYVWGDCERFMVGYLDQSASIKKGGETDRQRNEEGKREEDVPNSGLGTHQPLSGSSR